MCVKTKCRECGDRYKSCQLVNGRCAKCRATPVPTPPPQQENVQIISLPKEEVFKIVSNQDIIQSNNANYYS